MAEQAELGLTLVDRQGVTSLPDALAENGTTLDGMGTRARVLRHAPDAAAYLELHIEQGPVLEANEEAGRRRPRDDGCRALQPEVDGQAAHAGSTPMDQRRDALGGGVEARA